MDFGTIPINVNGNERWAISWENDANRCLYGPNDNTIQVSCASDSTYAELQTYEWKLKFSHGYLYGMSGCSTTAGIEAQRGNPTFLQGTGKYCWCKATGYKPNSSNSINVSLYTLSWVFAYEYGSFAACESLCALACDNFTVSRSYFRTALFTPLN
jgi:hypothetical protein